MNKMSSYKRYNHKGSLAITMMVVFVLVTLGVSFLVRGASNSSASSRVVNSSAALWATEAGIQKALWEYNYNNCAGMSGGSGCSGTRTLSGTLSGYGDYDVTMDMTNLTIQSEGSVPNRSAGNKVLRKVRGDFGRPAIFGFGMFAQGKLTLKQNSLVDAYDSRLGVYGGANIDHINGNIGSNGTTAGIVEVDNNATVWGSASTGPGGTVLDNGFISGSITHTNSIALPAVVVPTSMTGLTSSGTLTVGNNGSYTITGGDYKYSTISLGNQSVLNISGNVRLYLTGDASHVSVNTGTAHVALNILAGSTLVVYTDGVVTFDNNTTINCVSQKAQNLQIYSTYTGSNGVAISNNNGTYAAVYAPQTDINVSNNAGLYGAIVGKTTTLVNNGDIHYDVALGDMANPYDKAIMSSWQEYQ